MNASRSRRGCLANKILRLGQSPRRLYKADSHLDGSCYSQARLWTKVFLGVIHGIDCRIRYTGVLETGFDWTEPLQSPNALLFRRCTAAVDAKLVYEQTIRHFLTPVLPLLDAADVTEILINGPEQVYFERRGQLQAADPSIRFASNNALMAAARNIAEFAGRPFSNGQHSLDARLPDGSRVHVILPPSSRQGVCISIRKFSPSTLRLPSLVEYGSLTSEAAEFLGLAVALHRNILVAGGTGSGKTSLLNALSAEIDPRERIVVIEDSSELQLQQPHTVYLETQPKQPDGSGQVTIRDLFVDSLRMRPDRIVVGEVRRGEALDLVQSMISGHSGAMATVHASTPRDAAIRLETLSLMAGIDIPIYVARSQVASAVQLVVQINRFPDGSRRLQSISECLGLSESGEYQFRELYQFRAIGYDTERQLQGRLHATGQQPSFVDLIDVMGLRSRVEETKQLFPESAAPL